MTVYKIEDISYDDITEDLEFDTASRTITEGDVMQFAGLTGDFNQLHTSASYAEQTVFGARIAHGMLTLAIANGLYMRMNLFDRYTVANLGIEDWAFKQAVKIGDTLRVKITLAQKRLTKDPGRGIVKWKVQVLNQANDLVAQGIWVKLFLTRAGANAESDHKGGERIG